MRRRTEATSGFFTIDADEHMSRPSFSPSRAMRAALGHPEQARAIM